MSGYPTLVIPTLQVCYLYPLEIPIRLIRWGFHEGGINNRATNRIIHFYRIGA